MSEEAKASCGTCKHARAYEPSKFPEVPEPKFEGFDMFGLAMVRLEMWLMVTEMRNRHKVSVECRRFPEFRKRRKEEWCGEFDLSDQPQRAKGEGE